jgi:hypothetical protein
MLQVYSVMGCDRDRPALAADQGKSNNGNPLAPSHDTLQSFERGSADFYGRGQGHGCIGVAAVGGFLSCGCSVDKAEFRGYPPSERLSGMRCGPQW